LTSTSALLRKARATEAAEIQCTCLVACAMHHTNLLFLATNAFYCRDHGRLVKNLRKILLVERGALIEMFTPGLWKHFCYRGLT